MIDKRYTIGCITQLTETGVSQTVDTFGDVMTHAVDVQAAQLEDGIRTKLINLGWTPPRQPAMADDGRPPDWAVAMAFWEAFRECDHHAQWWKVKVDVFNRSQEIAEGAQE